MSDAELERFRNQRTVTRFGTAQWSRPGQQAETVEIVGWLREMVIVKTAARELRVVAFRELDAEAGRRLFGDRLKQHGGGKPKDTDTFRYHYPKDWDDRRREYHQGLGYIESLSTGRSYVFGRFITAQFNGEASGKVYLPPQEGDKPIVISLASNENKRNKTGGKYYTVSYFRMEPAVISQVQHLKQMESIRIRMASGRSTSETILTEDEVAATREALYLYEWSQSHGMVPP